MAKAHLLVASLACILPACGRAAPHGGFVARAAPGVTVIHGDEALAAGLEGRRVQLPVPEAPDSYVMLTGFLRTVHAHGAAFVSDIEVHVVAPMNGTWQECVTRLEPIDHGRPRVTKTTEPGQWVVAEEIHVRGSGPPTREAKCADSAPSSSPDAPTGACVTGPSASVSYVEHTQGWVWQPPETKLTHTWVSDWRLDPLAAACRPVAPRPDATPARSIQATVYGAL